MDTTFRRLSSSSTTSILIGAVASGEAALEAFHLSSYSLVITDIRMDGMNGIELLEEIKRIEPDTQVVVMTSHASLDSSIMALKSGHTTTS